MFHKVIRGSFIENETDEISQATLKMQNMQINKSYKSRVGVRQASS